MAAFFAVGLIAFEIMNRRANDVALLFTGSNRVHGMTDHLQRLKRHHHFVVFDVIADQHENFLRSHYQSPLYV